jgi:type IV pilus assembly protein PilM
LDISSTAVKLLELSHGPRSAAPGYHVESFSTEPLPPDAVVEKKIAGVEAVAESIKKAVQRSGTKAKRAAVAVSNSAVITKSISLPASLSEQEMETQIQLEADQYIPYPLEEVNIDFDVIGPAPSDPDRVEVLLAASRRENVDDRVSALEIAGLSATIVDVEAYAMEKACSLLADRQSEESPERIIALADMGATTTKLHVLHDNKIVYTREQNFGGRQLTDEIHRHLELAPEFADLNKPHAELPDYYVTEILTPFKDAMAQQISRALQFFYSTSAYNHIDQIVLAGGTSNLEGLADLVSERNAVPTHIANPFSDMSISARVNTEQLHKDAPAMMIAAGLALRSFD